MSDEARWFRRFLLGVAAAVYATVAVELWLIDHVEEWRQWVPIVVAGLGLAAVGGLAVRQTAAAVRAVRAAAAVSVVTAAAGAWLHVAGNYAFEREVNRAMPAAEAAWEALAGANPLLAPGMVALAGILAAAATRRMPTDG